jgi:antitoxin VapB
MTERAAKLGRLRGWMAERGIAAVHLTRARDIAWLTGGARTWIDIATDGGIAALWITAGEAVLLTNNIEAPRLADEEPLDGFEVRAPLWFATAELPGTAVRDPDLTPLWAPLHPAEVARFQALGADVGAALLATAQGLVPGRTEHEIAGELARAIYAIGAVPTVVQVAADDRAHRYRHALPTDARAQRTVLFGVCARRHGLIASASRMVSFGPADPALRHRAEAVAAVEAAAHEATRRGASLGAIFARIQEAYAAAGFDGEWRNHHQGGPCSYAARDTLAVPGAVEPVRAPQAFAWNPTVPGAKSEDTVLCSDDGCALLTRGGWPQGPIGNDILEL